jgi:hypothetical protein
VTGAATGEAPPARPDDRVPSAFRFATELVAWVATPWLLARYSWVLAVLSLVVLIGVPAVLATPGDKERAVVPVPGRVTIGMVVLELGAAVVSAWLLWPVWAAVPVSLLATAALVTELPQPPPGAGRCPHRWRWLLTLRQVRQTSGA